MEDVNGAQLDPAIAKRQAANKALIAKGIEMTRSIAQASFTRSVNANFDHATFIAAWAKVLRNRPDLAAHEHVGVALIIESKYGSALPVFRDPDQVKIADLAALVASTTDAAKNGKVPVAMLSGATTTVFDLTTYSMSSATPLLFPNQVTSVTIGYESATTKIVSLTIDLNFCDFYDGALLLDALVASL
jgi:pyruvate dehydrogenase E2 component (dihydrolipoamide acetyltransferase)